jgi:hypothetical protein
MAGWARRGDHARHPQARVRARAHARGGPRPRTGAGRGARPHRGGLHLRDRPAHPALGPVVVRARRSSAHARPRAVRDRRLCRQRRARRRGGRLRLGGEPRHLRRLLPLPDGQGAHVRGHADPRRRSRRRLRRLRRHARVRRLAQRSREAAARDCVPAGAVRQRRLRDVDAGPARPRRGGSRLRAGGALHDRHREGLRRGWSSRESSAPTTS